MKNIKTSNPNKDRNENIILTAFSSNTKQFDSLSKNFNTERIFRRVTQNTW